MLNIILGRAGSGKTGAVFDAISENVKKNITGNILIVPEQYSHEAERELAGICPDETCLYAEVLSFSRMASRVFAETGGLADEVLDRGGRVLAMSVALDRAANVLKTYGGESNKTDFITELINTYDELCSACAGTENLLSAAGETTGLLSDRLTDLAVIFESYEEVKEKSGLDDRDRMERLCEKLDKSTIGESGRIYIDGFMDFTAIELKIIDGLLKKNADITVSLTCESLHDSIQPFIIPSATARRLVAMAGMRGIDYKIELLNADHNDRPEDMAYLEKSLFDYSAHPFNGINNNISIYAAEDIYRECEFAASKVIELAEEGSRFREIAVVSPDWNRYASVVKGVFGRYGIPFNMADKSDVLGKPVMAFVLSALDTITWGWRYRDIFRYIKTGLAGITAEESDILENYVLKWDIQGKSAWVKLEPWNMHPEGYTEKLSPDDKEILDKINEIRRKVVQPLEFLDESLDSSRTAAGKSEALYDFLEKTEVYYKLQKKAEKLVSAGRMQLAEEYAQLWNILVNALVQLSDILNDSEYNKKEFAELIKLLLGQYEVGTIPASIDCVGVGDFTRTRKRGTKHLILIGATDNAMPSYEERKGVLSKEERNILRSQGVDLRDDEDEMIAREMGFIYASFTLPSQSITFTYPASSRKSYIISRIENLFNIREKYVTDDIYMMSVKPGFELAASSEKNPQAKAAEEYFTNDSLMGERLDSVRKAVEMPRETLGKDTSEMLFGKRISVTASRIDTFYSCRFQYFLQYGLGLKPRTVAALDAPETGTFMHYVMENITRESRKKGGFNCISDDELYELSDFYTMEYAGKKLGGLENKSGRFRYLFSRLSADAGRIVSAMADEMRLSDFLPLDFELRFAHDGDLPPIKGENGTMVSGIVDRVDGWNSGDSLYLRVIDYKTGKKSFSLKDVWYGMGMQMLIYLFALCAEGEQRYGMKIKPGGVLYTPLRDPILNYEYDPDDSSLALDKMKNLKRSGLLNDDPAVLKAMGKRNEGSYLPVKFNSEGIPSGDSIASVDQMKLLEKHVNFLIGQMGNELRKGTVVADPYFRTAAENACMNCDYSGVCLFSKNGEGEFRYLKNLSARDVWNLLEGEKNE